MFRETPEAELKPLAENTQRETIQPPQGLDAKHGGELFPEYIGINSGVRRASRGGLKIRPFARRNRALFLNLEFATFVFGRCADKPRHASASSSAFASFRSRVSNPSVNHP